ncbi:MAG: RadC family protein [Planctomycetota bacterium]
MAAASKLSRDRLLREGAAALADEELLALVLGHGGRDRSAQHCARELLASHGSLRRLSTRAPRELRRHRGVGSVRAARLAALFTLARRLMGERLRPGMLFANPRQIFDHYHGALRDLKREMFLVVLLDARHRVLAEEIVSEGSLTSSIVHPREVFMPAVRESAGAMVLVHNHPSGDPRPSDEDVAVTRRLVHASELLGIRVLDHVIVGDGAYASFKEAGLL